MMLTLIVSVTTWAAEPYFEVLRGSFQSGNVTVKVTFPGAADLEVGTTSLRHSDWDLEAHGWSPVAYDFYPTKEGNTMTVTFTGFTPLTGDLKYSVQSWDLKVDGVSYSSEIVAKAAMPYAEVANGDLSIGGNVTIDVTFPTFTSASAYPASWKNAALRYDGADVATSAMNQITNTGKTLHIPFNLAASPGSDLSLYIVNLPSGYVQDNGEDVYVEYNVSFGSAPSVDPGDEPGGNEPGGEEPGGEEPGVPVELANYFWVENLSEDATTISNLGKNVEYTSTPAVTDSWMNLDYQIDLAAHKKVYLRATAGGNTNMSGAIAVGGVGSTLNGNDEWVPFDTRVPYKVGGDITTLLNANGNVMALPAPEDSYGNTFGVFQNFFMNDTFLQDVSELVLPSTTLTENCYARMFNGCTNITTAPVLPATVLVNKCYDYMFDGCSSLNYVEAYFSEWPQKSGGYSPYAATENWLNGVASTGTFKTHDWVENNYRYYSSTYPGGWEKELLSSMNISVSAVGYTTFYYDRQWVMPEGMEGYVAYDKYNNGSYDFIFEKVFDAGDIVPSNQPLVLKANAGTYTINFTNDEPTRNIYEDEYLEFGGSVLTKDLTDENDSSNYYWYALSLDENGENVGFYWMKDEGAAFTSAPFKAYLHISKSHFQNGSSVKGSFVFGDFEGEADGINAVVAPKQKTAGIYDLSGRRVNGNAQHGLYIINGKKVVK